MKKLLSIAAIGLFTLSAATTAVAQTVEDQIKFRQSGYAFAAWNMAKIKAQTVDNSVPFDAAQVKASADAIAAIANSGMGALYSPGSENGTGWAPTRLKGNFFTDTDKVREVGMAFVTESNKLQEVAAGGDKAAIATQLDAVSKTCKACHDNFRTED